MRLHRPLALALVLTAASCGNAASAPAPSERPREAPPAPPPAAPDPPASPPCLPLVGGCGCAYACARGVRRSAGGSWEVVHDGLDGATVTALVERWCEGPAGLLSPEQAAGAGASGCRDVYYDGSPCGGECIPTTQFLTCRHRGDRCAP